MARESMEYDVVIVGAGPSGLSAAIRLGQLAKQHQHPLKIAVLEKGSEVGAHLISGAVLEPRALNELIPDWQNKGAPLNIPVTDDNFLFLTENKHFTLPTPPQMHNHGNYIISLGNLGRWLAKEAESLGVDIFPGFPAKEVLYDETSNQENNKVIGVITGDVGLDKSGQKTSNYQPGIEIRARYTLLAEGCRGSLTKTLCERFELQKNKDPKTYAIGIKEIWEIDPKKHKLGSVIHTIGWPLDSKTYGGSFIYHFENNQLSIGLVVGLDYENPYLDPFKEFQRFKHHPYVLNLLQGGRCKSYGARALNEGGIQSIPKLSFPGGLLIGCAAGFLNVPKIKGNHTAMKSGMLAAEAVFEDIKSAEGRQLNNYEKLIEESWIYEELKLARNIRPGFQKGLWLGLLNAGIDTYLFRGRAPWTLHTKHADNTTLKKAKDCRKISYPKPDGIISFDKLTALQLSNTNHEENQPCHLLLKNPNIPIEVNLKEYDGPEQRYCPANVYEIVRDAEGKNPYLQINAQNCLHCKTCDIKDPLQNITWVPPEGGGGPNYSNM